MKLSSRHIQGSFNSLCLKVSWLTFREYPSPLCLSVSQCLLTQTSQMVFQAQLLQLCTGISISKVSTGRLYMTQGLITTHTSDFSFRDASEHLKHPAGSGRGDRDPVGHLCLPAPPSRRSPKVPTQLYLSERGWHRIAGTQPWGAVSLQVVYTDTALVCWQLNHS